MDWAKMREVMGADEDDYRAYYTDEELEETPAQRKVRLAAYRAAKENAKAAKHRPGVCPKCGEHIGRGIIFHVRACDGRRPVDAEV